MSVLPNSIYNTTFQLDLTISAVAALVVVFVPAVASLGALTARNLNSTKVIQHLTLLLRHVKADGRNIIGAAPSAANATEVSKNATVKAKKTAVEKGAENGAEKGADAVEALAPTL